MLTIIQDPRKPSVLSLPDLMSQFRNPANNDVLHGKFHRPATAMLCAVALPGGVDEVSEVITTIDRDCCCYFKVDSAPAPSVTPIRSIVYGQVSGTSMSALI